MADINAFGIIRASVQDVHIKDMQPYLWSTLPSELVAMIIRQTIHQPTQDAWCLATADSPYLHEIAMMTRWHSTTIDDRDLMSAPGGDRLRFYKTQREMQKHGISHDWKPAGEMPERLLATNESGRCPANYIRHITFDFKMLRYWTDEAQRIETGVYHLMPSLESVEYTLDQLKESLYSLKRVTCYGDTPQTALNFVARHATGIEELELRGLETCGSFYISRSAHINHAGSLLCLELGSLSVLQRLVRLKIHEFTSSEIEGLRHTLPKLINLESLELACLAREWGESNGGLFENLLCSTMPERYSGPASWLPLGLKCLSMIDTYFIAWAEGELVRPLSLLFPDNLEYLNIDFIYKPLAALVLDHIDMRSLKFLAIPKYCAQPHNTLGQSAFHDIMRGSGSQLASIRILRAWDYMKSHAISLQSPYNFYAVQDLVLGTRNASFYQKTVVSWKVRVPNPTFLDCLGECGLLDPETTIADWGENIKRLRIDHIDIVPDLDVSILSKGFGQNLKILMLQPASRHGSSNREHHDDGLLIDQEICDKLAHCIASNGSRCLRVIVISAQWYWLSRDTNTEPTQYSLWSWATAKSNEQQKILMASILDQSDMEFLENKDVPYWCERDSREWHRNLASYACSYPHMPTAKMMHQWNYLTMHRVQGI